MSVTKNDHFLTGPVFVMSRSWLQVGFSRFFMVPGWFFMVPGRFFMVPGHFSWFQVGFHGFSWFQVGSSWFFMVFLQNVPARTVFWPDDPI